MAHEYTTWVYQQDIRGAGRKFVLIALADIADDRGYAFPGQKRLTHMTGQSERSVREHLEWLEANGYIRRKQRRREDGTRTSDAYFLPEKDSTGNICRWPTTGNNRRLTEEASTTDQDATPDQSATGESRRLSASRSTGKSRRTNRQISPKSPAESAGHELPEEPSVEPSLTPLPPKGGSGAKAPRSNRSKTRRQKRHEFNPLDPELQLPDNFDRELFADFCARRLEIGKPMTVLALRHFVEAHRHHPPETLDEMFRRSIRAGWPDLYPIERTHGSASSPGATAWEVILDFARRGKPPEGLDDRAAAALKAVGGWSSVGYCPNHLLGQKRSKFLDAYEGGKRGKEAA